MSKFFFGTKGKMTQVFSEENGMQAVTIVNVPAMVVTQVKTKEVDGYAAVQVGAGTRKVKNIAKPQQGHLKDLAMVRKMREFSQSAGSEIKRGDIVEPTIFEAGELVTVSAISKGKGFQGVVKRHGFHGGPRSHGQKNKERSPGSISGAGRAGGRVSLGMRMAGRMGGDRITIKNLKIVSVDVDSHTILIAGAVPGTVGTLVEIHGQTK